MPQMPGTLAVGCRLLKAVPHVAAFNGGEDCVCGESTTRQLFAILCMGIAKPYNQVV